MPILRIEPNSDILTEWQGGYANVDEYPISNSDYDQQASDFLAHNDFGVQDHTSEAGTITKIVVYCAMDWGYSHVTHNYGIKIGSTRYVVSGVDGSHEWTVNPATASAWTWSDIDALVLTLEGQRGVSSMAWARCYGIYIEVTYVPPPTVTTQAVTAVGKATATGNGNVTSDNGATVTERGVCYCLTSHGTPDTGDGKAIATGTTGAFTASITGLTPVSNYNARAYATSSSGTAYGDMVSFTTQIAATYLEILTSDRALALDNATAFTPSADYHPATKKYADSKVSDAIFSADWEGVTDLAPSKNAIFDKVQSLVAGGFGDFLTDGSIPMTGDLNANGHQMIGLAVPDALGESIRQTAKITEAKLESATDNDPSTLLTERGSIITRNATIPAELKHGLSGQVLTSGGHGADASWAFGTACFGLTIDGGSSEITAGIKGYVTIPYACTIVAWYITSDVLGACVIDVWKAAGVIPTVVNTIVGTEKPTLSSAAVNSNTNPTTWTVAVSAGDVIGFNVVSNVNCKKISLVIKVAK